jgi:hypothetical protein
MSSKRKIDSARANGKKSHGPITGQGLKTSSMNALKHGFTARTVVFANENQDEYDALLLSYVHDLHPADSVEMDHVVDMVNAKWQQRRLNNSETAMFERKMVDQKEELDKVYDFYDEAHAHAFAFQDLSESGSLQTLHRALAHVERNYYRALNNLLRLRKIPKSKPAATIHENEKRTQSQVRTPAASPQSPLHPPAAAGLDPESQHQSHPPATQPSISPANSDPTGAT